MPMILWTSSILLPDMEGGEGDKEAEASYRESPVRDEIRAVLDHRRSNSTGGGDYPRRRGQQQTAGVRRLASLI